MAITNHERVGKALQLLKAGLAPFCARDFTHSLDRRNRGAESSTARLRGEPEIARRAQQSPPHTLRATLFDAVGGGS